MRKQNFGICLLGMALLSFLSSCRSLEVKNQRWCVDFDRRGADCFQTLVKKEQHIPKPQWDRVRRGLACTEIATFADIKAALEKACSKVRCKYDKKPIEDFMANLDRLQKKSIRQKLHGEFFEAEASEDLSASFEFSQDTESQELPDESYLFDQPSEPSERTLSLEAPEHRSSAR